MATTIKSTSLDFDTIKNNLKTFLAAQPEFADYNFESSGLSNILDVLAYNTHYNGLIANFALNESFLGTAQLRSSLVSLAEGIGYIPKSKIAAQATVNLSVNLSGVTGRPASITIPAGKTFNCGIEDVTYVFNTQDILYGTDNGTGLYELRTSTGSRGITLYEGQKKTKTFLVGAYSENAVYIIPDKNIDISTAVVKVFENASTSAFTTYSNIQNATTINDETTLYILKESPNGFYELSFGDGITLGKSPQAGYKVVVEYLATNGPSGNGGSLFVPSSKLSINGREYSIATTTVSSSIGGAEKESPESIRKNAPFQYAAQNRMVTAEDYSSLVKRNFSTLIKDIKAWGGEDNVEPEYGVVFLSIDFEDDVSNEVIDITKTSIKDLTKQLSVVSFELKYSDPITTYIEANVFFQFNPKLTTLSVNSIQDTVLDTINNYFNTNIGRFEQSFRRSNLLADVDETNPAVLSSRADIKMQQRISPQLDSLNDFTIKYPVAIAIPDDVDTRVTSSLFTYQNKTCKIENKLNTAKLQIVSVSDDTVVVDNIGEYEAAKGIVNIVGFKPSAIVTGDSFVKISVVPANASAISPELNNILKYDEDPSFATGIVVDTI